MVCRFLFWYLRKLIAYLGRRLEERNKKGQSHLLTLPLWLLNDIAIKLRLLQVWISWRHLQYRMCTFDADMNHLFFSCKGNDAVIFYI